MASTERPPTVTERTLEGVVWAGAAFAVFFTVARMAIRVRMFGRIYSDDILVLVALFLLVASAVTYQYCIMPMFTIVRVASGLQPPKEDFLAVASLYLKLQFALTLLFWSVLWTVKLSFLAFFRRLSSGLSGQQYAWWFVLGFVILSYIGCVISYPISCSSFVLGACSTKRNVDLSLLSLKLSTSVDVLSDMMIIALPIHLLWKVKITPRQKWALAGIFSLGIIIIVFAIIRVIVTNTTGTHPEPTWLATWSAIESSVAVIVCSLASFKALFTRANGSYSSGGYGRGYASGDQPEHSRGRNKHVRFGSHTPSAFEGTRSSAFSAGKGNSLHSKQASNGSSSSEDDYPKHSVHIRTDLHVKTEPVSRNEPKSVQRVVAFQDPYRDFDRQYDLQHVPSVRDVSARHIPLMRNARPDYAREFSSVRTSLTTCPPQSRYAMHEPETTEILRESSGQMSLPVALTTNKSLPVTPRGLSPG